MDNDTLRTLARIGAKLRLVEIEQEMAALQAFMSPPNPATGGKPRAKLEVAARITKKHWTQTAEGKKRLRRQMKASWKRRQHPAQKGS